MREKSAASLFVVIFLLVIGYATLDVMLSASGPLATAAKWIGVPLILISLVYPKAGLGVLSLMCFYGDYYKKLAVYNGIVSMQTVMEVLALNMAILGAILAGTVFKIIRSGKWPSKPIVLIFIFSVLATGIQLIGSGPFTTRVQGAVNGGLYLSLAAVIGYYYSDKDSSLKLSRWQFMLGIPWLLAAIWQFFYGFSEVDEYYARTFLSPVFSTHFFMEKPRIFGFAGSVPAFGAISFCCVFGLWHLARSHHHRFLYFSGSILYLVTLVLSAQRTALLIVPIILIVYQLFKTRTGTRLFYIGAVSSMVILIASSNYLLSKISLVEDDLISMTGDAGLTAQVVRVGTYTDRIKGWTRLTKLNSYSLLGTGRSEEPLKFQDDDYSHDAINSILISYGVLGLFIAIAGVTWILSTMHKVVLNTKDMKDRETMAFSIAVITVILSLGTMGGSNFHTVPINLLFATFLGHAASVINRLADEKKALKRKNESEKAMLAKQLQSPAINAGQSAGRFRPQRSFSSTVGGR